MKDLFLNKADINTENSSYVFISDNNDIKENMLFNLFKND